MRVPSPPRWWRDWGRDVVTLAAIGLAAWSVLSTVAEGDTRADQVCSITEANQTAEVKQLARTYSFLVRATEEQLRDPTTIYPEVLRGLPALESEAHRDNAPPFCDEPGIGLPEPDYPIPARPVRVDIAFRDVVGLPAARANTDRP